MPTDLAAFIGQTKLCDTHEHLRSENDWVENGPDILQDLFGNYVPADLHAAGADGAALSRLFDKDDPDLGGRFSGIEKAWDAIRLTGYGEAVRILAHQVYGMTDFSAAELQKAQSQLQNWQKPGGRLELLQKHGGLDHVQTDNFCWPCQPDASGPDFFLYDLSWVGFCNGEINPAALHAETGVQVRDLPTLRQAMEALFAQYGPTAIAVKSQHAYNRTLAWSERNDTDAAAALQQILSAADAPVEAHLCLGDWAWARGIEFAIEYNLPFKIHTGYYAGNDRMPVDFIKSGNLCPLLARYLDCRFVLMHIAYPYSDEIIALAKHYRNVWVDMCWAWSIDPYSSADFVRRFIHAAPANKLFGFGGDTMWPTSSVAYALQTRRWLTYALEAEVKDGLLSETDALGLAARLMHDNAYECFDLEGTRKAIASHS